MAQQLGPSKVLNCTSLARHPRGLRRALLRRTVPRPRRHTTNGVAPHAVSLATSLPLVVGWSHSITSGSYHGASLWFTTLCALSVALGALSYNLMATLSEFFHYERRGQEPPRPRAYLHGVDVTHSRFLQLPSVLAAVEFAAEAHRHQRRKTGEPYVTHCIETALIVEACLPQSHSADEQERHVACIMAAVLHDVIDDTPTEISAMTAAFGPRVSALVSQVSKLSQMNQLLRRGKRQGWAQYSPDHFKQLRKLIVDLAFEEPLVILVKLADRLHNMRTVYVLAPDKQRSVAEETLEVWCSMAESLGWDGLKSEMEDLCFAVLQPTTYCTLRSELDRLWSLPTLAVVEEQLGEQDEGGQQHQHQQQGGQRQHGKQGGGASGAGGDALGIRIVQVTHGPEAPVRHYERAAGVRAAAAERRRGGGGGGSAVAVSDPAAAAVAATAVPLPRATTATAVVAVAAAAADAVVLAPAAAAAAVGMGVPAAGTAGSTAAAVAVLELEAPSVSSIEAAGSDGGGGGGASSSGDGLVEADSVEVALVTARVADAASVSTSKLASSSSTSAAAAAGFTYRRDAGSPHGTGRAETRVAGWGPGDAGGTTWAAARSDSGGEASTSGSSSSSGSNSSGDVVWDASRQGGGGGGGSDLPYPLSSFGTLESVDGPLVLDEIVLPYGLTAAMSAAGAADAADAGGPPIPLAIGPSDPGQQQQQQQSAHHSPTPSSSSSCSSSQQPLQGHRGQDRLHPERQQRQQQPQQGEGQEAGQAVSQADGLAAPSASSVPSAAAIAGPSTTAAAARLPPSGPPLGPLGSLIGLGRATGQAPAPSPSSPSPSSPPPTTSSAAATGLPIPLVPFQLPTLSPPASSSSPSPAASSASSAVPPVAGAATGAATGPSVAPLSPQQERLKLILSTVVPFEAVGFKNLRGLASSARRGLEVLDECAALLYNEIQIRSQAGGLGINIQGRLKSLHSVYRKMVRKTVAVAQVYDSRALRVIVDDGDGSSLQEAVEVCYRLVSAVHSIWKPIKREFDDYIANPKPSGYQALHTAVRGPGGIPMEVQIKTSSMHDLAEYGAAAHWVYKEYTPMLQSPGRGRGRAGSRGGGGGGGRGAQERLPEGYVGQPLLKVAKDKLRYGVVVSREQDGQRLVAAVKLGSTFPPFPTRVPDFSFYASLVDYTRSKGWQVPGHGDIVLRLEEFVKCDDGRYHRRDHMGYLLPAETITLLEGFEEDAAAAARERQRLERALEQQQQQQQQQTQTQHHHHDPQAVSAPVAAPVAAGGGGNGGEACASRSSLDEEGGSVLGAGGEAAEQRRFRQQMRVTFAKTQQLRSMIEWGRGAIGKYAASPDDLQTDEVSVLIWPGGRIEHWARGTTAGDIVAAKGIITTGEGYDGYRVNLLINVNNRLVPEDTVLNDGDLVILAREKVRI